jgi:hypothetical protein
MHVGPHADRAAAAPAARRTAPLVTAALVLAGAVVSVPLVAIGAFGALSSDSAWYTMTAFLLGAPALALWVTRRRSLRAVAAGLVIGGVSMFVWLHLPPGPSPAETEARLRTIASHSSEPIYYLGSSFEGTSLNGAYITNGSEEAVSDDTLDPGQSIDVSYQFCGEGECTELIEIRTERSTSQALGCTSLGLVRGVPAVRRPGEVLLYTSDLTVHLLGPETSPDLARATATANALRQVGQARAAGGDLPPPVVLPSPC